MQADARTHACTQTATYAHMQHMKNSVHYRFLLAIFLLLALLASLLFVTWVRLKNLMLTHKHMYMHTYMYMTIKFMLKSTRNKTTTYLFFREQLFHRTLWQGFCFSQLSSCSNPFCVPYSIVYAHQSSANSPPPHISRVDMSLHIIQNPELLSKAIECLEKKLIKRAKLKTQSRVLLKRVHEKS